MKLDETLYSCIMAVANRYPQYVVDIDKAPLRDQSVKFHEGPPLELLEQLQALAPELLYAPAHLECDIYRCELRVVGQPEEKSVILFHFPRVLDTSPALVAQPVA